MAGGAELDADVDDEGVERSACSSREKGFLLGEWEPRPSSRNTHVQRVMVGRGRPRRKRRIWKTRLALEFARDAENVRKVLGSPSPDTVACRFKSFLEIVCGVEFGRAPWESA